MAENSRISWCTHSWNTAVGCHSVSKGCTKCYARTLVENRMGKDFSAVTKTAPATFRAPLKWAKKTPGARVFANSLSDFFLEEQDPWRAEAWDIIRQTPELIYLILTKRPERIAQNLPVASGNRTTQHQDPTWPWQNVWLGVSVETQKYTSRMDVLRQVPVHDNQRFISAEPLLGPLELDLSGYRWAISGGESGPGHRPMDLQWCRSIRDQCEAAGVMYHHKQGSHLRPGMDTLLDGVEHRAVPGGIA